MKAENRKLTDIVTQGVKELGIKLPADAAAKFETYSELLIARSRNVNLTAITSEEDVARLHFLDSLALLKAAPFKYARVIDIGSGAGFPGVPLKIAEPMMKLTLLDATGKRVAFLSELCEKLEIEAACVHARAEDMAKKPDMMEQYDIAISRAVARLNVLCELCLPFIRVEGVFIAMKGVDSGEELAEAGNAIKTLGAELQEIFDYRIPGADIAHRAVIIRKTAHTPDKYPRRFARIQQAPL